MNDKLLNILTGLLFVLGVGCIIYVFVGNFSQEMKNQNFGNLACVERTQIMANIEESMAGKVALNDRYKVLHNYYSCNKVEREQLVLFQFSKSIPPVVRIVMGLPGDKFTVQKDSSDQNKWVIRINGEGVSGTTGEVFITSQTTPPLKTYEMSRNGVLGENEYIIFADKSPSISDSSNLGIIRSDTLVGRAFPFSEAPGS